MLGMWISCTSEIRFQMKSPEAEPCPTLKKVMRTLEYVSEICFPAALLKILLHSKTAKVIYRDVKECMEQDKRQKERREKERKENVKKGITQQESDEADECDDEPIYKIARWAPQVSLISSMREYNNQYSS